TRGYPSHSHHPAGGGDFYTRLTLDEVELVHRKDWTIPILPWAYGNETVAKAEEDARRSLLARYLERQLQADRVLTLTNMEYKLLYLLCADLTLSAPFHATREERQLARDQGLTRAWDWELDEDFDKEHYFVRDKLSWE
ncbi:hypothetical protein THAOC_04501, partial [Thalassiosira oceanica]